MAKENEIVSLINSSLQSSQFSASKFAKGSWNGIGELVKSSDTGETTPVIIANDGTTTKLSINDVYPFQVYHRVLSSVFNENEDNDFGDWKYREQTTSMTMVVIADRERLEVTKEKLITAITLGLILELTATSRQTLALQNATIIPNEFITNFNEVYSREFNIEDYLLKPQTIMIALNYDIVTLTSTSCIEICD